MGVALEAIGKEPGAWTLESQGSAQIQNLDELWSFGVETGSFSREAEHELGSHRATGLDPGGSRLPQSVSTLMDSGLDKDFHSLASWRAKLWEEFDDSLSFT